MELPDPYYIVLDIVEYNQDIIDCVLLIYQLEESESGNRKLSQKPERIYMCQFSDQGQFDQDNQEDRDPMFRPYRIWDPPSGKHVKKFRDQRLLKKILKGAGFTIVPEDVPDRNLDDIRAMYKDLQLNKIYRATFCYHCRKQNGRYIFLTDENQIPLDTGVHKFLCEGCAWNVLLKRLDIRGVKVTAGLREILISKFKKFRDIDRIERTFDPKWNPIEDADFSLFDVQDLITEPYEPMPVHELKAHPKLVKNLKSNGIRQLLPVQVKAVHAGLLEGKNLLIASSTSSGKTLIGEIAGINALLENGTGAFLFVVPLVALANQKYSEFKEKYGKLGFKVSIRVGRSRIEKSENLDASGGSGIRGAQVIVGTYEGVDYLLRAGKARLLPRLTTVVIDEIQMFRDEDRGTRLDGFMARLKMLHPDAQFIYLSATVANPSKLARNLDAKLVDFFERPVPLERHLIPCLNESEKLKLMSYLVKKEFKNRSSFGFKGQSIVFTHSRRSVHELARYLKLDHVSVNAYHSGLTYDQRLGVERRFVKQDIGAVVTTAALGAGVDLPASQVIFFSLTMGIDWLTVAEFNQMLGRAGRFNKHDMGKVYILVEPGKSYHGSQALEEDKVALKLLTGEMQETSPPFDIDKNASEVLAFIAMKGKTNLQAIERFHLHMLGKTTSTIKLLNYLHDNKLISVKNGGEYIAILPIGRATCESFLDVKDGMKLKKLVRNYEETILDIASTMNPLKNVYLTNSIIADLTRRKHGGVRASSRFFSSHVLDLMSLETATGAAASYKRKKLSKRALEILARWAMDIFTCECEEKPYCNCGMKMLGRIILELRRKRKMKPKNISYYLRDKYEIRMYAGDIHDFLNSILHGLDAIERFARIFEQEDMLERINTYRSTIENP
ncbi:DEAD/DEAH box helicase [Candidatus Bathyarchaeota archaeon]|nr:DEAD/DEAH box helicase [Candidatus Bathyarchaeota archaeon]